MESTKERNARIRAEIEDIGLLGWIESDIRACQKAEQDFLRGNGEEDIVKRFCIRHGMYKQWLSTVRYYDLTKQMNFIRNSTDSICLHHVSFCGLALQFVYRQTPEICRAAIAQDGNARKFVK